MYWMRHVLLAAAVAAYAGQAIAWNYESDADEMGSGKVKTATARSLNDVDFGFPYKGKQSGMLMLRNHPRRGKDVIFAIEKGQIVCGIRECNINVKFGDGKPVVFTAAPPADHNSTAIFIRGHDRFVSNLKKVNEVRIEVQFYQQGVHVFRFDVSDLKWP